MSVRFNDLEAPLTSARVLSVVIEETTDWNLLTGGELKTDNSREVWLWIRTKHCIISQVVHGLAPLSGLFNSVQWLLNFKSRGSLLKRWFVEHAVRYPDAVCPRSPTIASG